LRWWLGFNEAPTKMIRAAAVFGCVAASGTLSASEPKHVAVTDVRENKQETHVMHVHAKTPEPKRADTKKTAVVLTRKAIVPKHQDAVKATAEEKHVKPVALSRKSVAVKPLEPKLIPESDEKFMKGDYPYDNRPKVTEKFEGVYPKMQSTEKYNSD